MPLFLLTGRRERPESEGEHRWIVKLDMGEISEIVVTVAPCVVVIGQMYR